jgi:hypothetical protein
MITLSLAADPHSLEILVNTKLDSSKPLVFPRNR